MARPSKPVIVLEMEGRSHRTKEELKTRQAGEAQTLSGLRLSERPEVKTDAAAHREFLRLKKLLGAMEKDDAAYTGIINRYCQIYAECLSLSERRERFELGAEDLRNGYGRGEIETGQYYELLRDMQKNINAVDKIADSKRQMLLAIEKECCLTVAAALRAVPKKPSEKENTDPMASLLGRRA